MKVKAYCVCGEPVLIPLPSDKKIEIINKLEIYRDREYQLETSVSEEEGWKIHQDCRPYYCNRCKRRLNTLQVGWFRWEHYKNPNSRKQTTSFVRFIVL